MNRSQKLIAGIGCLVLAGMLAVPPWVASFAGYQLTQSLILMPEERPAGYSLFASRPAIPNYTESPMPLSVMYKATAVAKEMDRSRTPNQPVTSEAWLSALGDDKTARGAVGRGEVRSVEEWWLLNQSPLAGRLKDYLASSVSIDTSRLLIQCGIAVVLTVGGCLVFQGKTRREPQAAERDSATVLAA